MFLSNLNSLVKKTSIIIASKQSYSVRLNEVNVQMINEKYRSLIFGEKKEKASEANRSSIWTPDERIEPLGEKK